MKIFVINLKSSADRRVHVDRQLQAAQLNYSYFDAINGHDGYAPFFASYDERAYLINTGRRATPGEIGCYASHLALWKKCVELDEPILIMEDDFLLDPLFAAAVATTEKIILKYGFIRLHTETRARKKKLETLGDFSLYVYTKMPQCLMCYALTPAVAQAFIASSKILVAPVDGVVKKTWEHQQPLYGLLPYTVHDGAQSHVTTIKGRLKADRNLWLRVLRFVTKIDWMVQRAVFNFRSAPKREGKE